MEKLITPEIQQIKNLMRFLRSIQHTSNKKSMGSDLSSPDYIKEKYNRWVGVPQTVPAPTEFLSYRGYMDFYDELWKGEVDVKGLFKKNIEDNVKKYSNVWGKEESIEVIRFLILASLHNQCYYHKFEMFELLVGPNHLVFDKDTGGAHVLMEDFFEWLIEYDWIPNGKLVSAIRTLKLKKLQYQ